jgi:GAF domain/Sel1 repeat/PilZ domain
MDRSVPELPDPVAGPQNGERRRCVRQKLHTPVYVSFNGPQTGMVVDLSELLDLHEHGFAVRTSEPLEMNRAVTLCLDLPETKSYIHGSGQVIWSDETGRGGIRFSPLPESSRLILKEWLFANLLIACSNHAARTEQLTRHQAEKLPEPALVDPMLVEPAISDGREMHSAVETGLAPSQALQPASLQVEAVRREVIEIGGDFDAVLQLIADRALSLTEASGTALAFLTDNKMICRARAGEPAPPLGAPVDVKQGLSGECVRSGSLVSCEDTDNDPRIAPEVGRALGIGSLMAVPIVSDFRVLGLLEVFSPRPRAFTTTHATVLEQLVEMIPKTHGDQPPSENIPPENTQLAAPIQPEAKSQPPDAESASTEFDSIPAIREALKERELEAPEQLSHSGPGEIIPEQVPEQDPETVPAAPSRLLPRALLGLVIVVVAMAVTYLLGPTIEKRLVGSPQASQRPYVETGNAASVQRAADRNLTERHATAKSLPELRKLADQGDADAQWQMAVHYHNGEGVPQDDAQAVQWFRRAAEQGNVDAQAHLGAYYWAGRGVPEDLSQAYFWSEIALAGGDENSKSRLEGLASLMTRPQVLAAQQQADAWLHTHNAQAKSSAN